MPDFRSLTLKQLRALAGTVRNGSVTAAARGLGVTPPAITTQLKILEKSVGAPLFDRSADGFVPTDVGAVLVETAGEIEKLIASTATRIADLRSGAAGTVLMGAVSTAKYIAPRIAAAFQAAHPQLRIRLAIGNRGEMIKGLESSAFDLLMMGQPPAHLPLASAALGDHPHVMISPRGHRLAGVNDIVAEDLIAERFLAREPGSGTRILMERFLERFGAGRPFDIIEMGTNETIKQAVMAGLGISIISAHTCIAELDEGRLVVLRAPGLPLVRQWFLVHRVDRQLPAAAETLKAFLLAHSDKLVPRARRA
ncbi:MAG: LysR family transcriptional regulator [Hyphomicrobiaceae bacterium]